MSIVYSKKNIHFWYYIGIFLILGSLSYLGVVPLGAYYFFATALFLLMVLSSQSPVDFRLKILAIGFYVLATLLESIFFPILAGPDATQYFLNTKSYSFEGLVNYLVNSDAIVRSPWGFPLIVKAFVGSTVNFTPNVIIYVNSIFWILASLFWTRAIASKYGTLFARKQVYQGAFVFLLVSPTIIMWTSSFHKELLALSVNILSAVFFYERRYFSGAIFLVVGAMLRPYSIALVAAYYLFLRPSRVLIFLSFIVIVIFFLFYSKGNPVPLANIPLTAGYSILSPNPFDLSNWQFDPRSQETIKTVIFLTIEGIVYAIAMVLALFWGCFNYKESRETFIQGLLPFLMIASVLTILGYNRTFYGLDETYGFLDIGGHIARKKLMVFPILIPTVVLSIALFLQALLSSSINKRDRVWR